MDNPVQGWENWKSLACKYFPSFTLPAGNLTSGINSIPNLGDIIILVIIAIFLHMFRICIWLLVISTLLKKLSSMNFLWVGFTYFVERSWHVVIVFSLLYTIFLCEICHSVFTHSFKNIQVCTEFIRTVLDNHKSSEDSTVSYTTSTTIVSLFMNILC